MNIPFFNNSKKLSNDKNIKSLMVAFTADEYGHECKTDKSDLGYGWIHYGLIRQQKPKNILCVGSRHGYIPAILAQACKDNKFGKVDFVDAGYGADENGGWTGVGFWKTDVGKQIFNKFGLEKYLQLHVMTNEEFSNNNQQVKYDYVYIDGDHSLRGVTKDFRLFWPKLHSGGYMTFHDICVKGTKPEGLYGVWKFWELLKEKLAGIQIDFIGSGLGIIQKR